MLGNNSKIEILQPSTLDSMSIKELKDYVENLKNEIIRVELNIQKKEQHKSDVENIFNK